MRGREGVEGGGYKLSTKKKSRRGDMAKDVKEAFLTFF